MSPAVVRLLRLVAFGSLLVCASAHAEKKIYACKDAAGNAVFSSQPCGPDAREVHVNAGSTMAPPEQAETPAPQESPPPAAAPASDLPATPVVPDRAQEAACRDAASRAGTQPSEEQLRLLEIQRTSVINAIAHGEANEAQAAEIEASIEHEQARIASARQKADAAVREAMADCLKPKIEREHAPSEQH